MTCLFSSGTGEQGEKVSHNLAWEKIQGLMHIWNNTDPRVCVQIPKSSGEGTSFFIINFNFSKILESNLNTIVKNPVLPAVLGAE